MQPTRETIQPVKGKGANLSFRPFCPGHHGFFFRHPQKSSSFGIIVSNIQDFTKNRLAQGPMVRVLNRLGRKGHQVVLTVEAGPGPFACPSYHQAVRALTESPRRGRHLDTLSVHHVGHAELPWVSWPTHGMKQLPAP